LSRTNDKGFTLIELIMFIIIGAIFLPASMIAFTSVMSNYSRPDHYVKARFYADKRMAEITSTLYDNVTAGNLSCYTTSSPVDSDFRIEWASDDKYKTACRIETVNPFDLSTKSPTSSYYKRVTVTVKHSDLLIDEISTIITRRPNMP